VVSSRFFTTPTPITTKIVIHTTITTETRTTTNATEALTPAAAVPPLLPQPARQNKPLKSCQASKQANHHKTKEIPIAKEFYPRSYNGTRRKEIPGHTPGFLF
jgi:hypothetical protein